MKKWAQVAEETGRAPGMGMPEISMPSDAFAVVCTSRWRHTALGIPKQTSIATSKVPRL
jgi:hypothetical protein